MLLEDDELEGHVISDLDGGVLTVLFWRVSCQAETAR